MTNEETELKWNLFLSGYKVCGKCKIEKEVKQFHNHKNTKDGLQARCKICTRIASLSIPQTIKSKYQSQYRNKDEVSRLKYKEYQRKYRESQKGLYQVYIMTSPKTEKVYVGFTSQSLKLRKQNHKAQMDMYIKKDWVRDGDREVSKESFYYLINELGLTINDFSIKVLDVNEDETTARRIERDMIELFENEYGTFNLVGTSRDKTGTYER